MNYKQKSLAIIISSLVIIFLLIWFPGLSLLASIADYSKQAIGYQEQIVTFSNFSAYMTKLNQSYRSREEDINRIDDVIVKNTEDGKLDFLKDVEYTADLNSILLEKQVLGESTNKNKAVADKTNTIYTNFMMGLRAKGTFSALLDFLTEVENSHYRTNIDSISVSHVVDPNAPQYTIDSNMKMKVFIKP